MNKIRLDLHRVHLAYQVNVKEILDEQKEEREKFFQDIERNNISKSGIAYKKTLDLLFKQIESRTYIYYKSLFDTIPVDSVFGPDFQHEIFTSIDTFIDQAVIEVNRLIESRISRDRLGQTIHDSILNDLNGRSLKIKSHFRRKAQLEFIERKGKTSELDAKPPELLQQLKWILKCGWKHKWYILLALTLVVAYKLLC